MLCSVVSASAAWQSKSATCTHTHSPSFAFSPAGPTGSWLGSLSCGHLQHPSDTQHPRERASSQSHAQSLGRVRLSVPPRTAVLQPLRPGLLRGRHCGGCPALLPGSFQPGERSRLPTAPALAGDSFSASQRGAPGSGSSA